MRRGLVVAAAFVAACGGRSAPVVPAAPTSPAPWPMFRGSPSHAGDFSDRPTPQWRTRWSVDVGERIDASAVITSDGRAIVATRSGTVVALAMADGAERQRIRLGGGVWSSPALVGGVLVVASKDGAINGLHWRTFERLWAIDAPSASFSAVTAVDGTAYLVSGTELFAVEATSGAVRWRRPLGAPSFTAPAYDAVRSQLVIGTRAGQVQAYGLDGRLRWEAMTKARAHNDGSPTVAGDRVLIGSNDNALHAFDLHDGHGLWKTPTSHWVVSTPAFADGVAYFGDDGGRLRAVTISSGASLWQSIVGDDLASSPTLVGALLVHGSHDGKVHAWNPETGDARTPIDAGAAMYASPAVDTDGTIVIGTQRGRVLAVE